MEIPALVRCVACRAEFEPLDAAAWLCSSCGAAAGEFIHGSELIVERVVLRGDPNHDAAR